MSTDGAVAWAVCNPAGVYYRSFGYKHEALECCLEKIRETGDAFYMRPLYLSPRLTDAEREAVASCIADDEAATAYNRAATLRGLLEQTGERTPEIRSGDR